MMTENSCAFTGHRPHKFPWGYDEQEHRCIALKNALDEQIQKLIKAGTTKFFAGMAEGTDCRAALSVLAHRKTDPTLKLRCVLPWEGPADGWASSAKERYGSILRQADSITYVSRAFHKGCMLERNRFLVDSAPILLAVYNGEWRGGTAATVRYAQKKGKEIIPIDPMTLSVALT